MKKGGRESEKTSGGHIRADLRAIAEKHALRNDQSVQRTRSCNYLDPCRLAIAPNRDLAAIN